MLLGWMRNVEAALGGRPWPWRQEAPSDEDFDPDELTDAGDPDPADSDDEEEDDQGEDEETEEDDDGGG